MSEWQPSPESLHQLAACFKDVLNPLDRDAQKQAEKMLESAKSNPDFINYLAYIFSSSEPPATLACSVTDYQAIRQSAAIMIKNSIRNSYRTIPNSGVQLVRMAVQLGIQDSVPGVRSNAGNIITEIVKRAGIQTWPEVIPFLMNLAINENGSASAAGQEGAITAIAKICEDNGRSLNQKVNGHKPTEFLIPKLIIAAGSSNKTVRVYSLIALNEFTNRSSQVLLDNVDNLLRCLFQLSNDPNTRVRKQICRSFIRLIGTRPDRVFPHIDNLVDYMILQHKSDDQELAQEAVEFWLTVADHPDLHKALEPYLDKVIPVLLATIVYSPEEISLFGNASDDDEEEDSEQDIKPAIARAAAARNAKKNGEGTSAVISEADDDDDDIEEGEVADDLDYGDDPEQQWTLRKCSAASLDSIARQFKGPVFEFILPYLTENLKHNDWPNREAAILALGAVAQGCLEVVSPHLFELMPYLITLLEDPEPLVRQISCWTISRYSGWAVALSDESQKRMYFVPMMDGILKRMLDKNKKVQEASSSAFARLQELSAASLKPYCGPIVQQFVRCFAKYKGKNIYVLYDCIQTLADSVGSVLASPELMAQLMPPILDRYNRLSDDSREMVALLECLACISVAVGEGFVPYAENTFRRSLQIVHNNLQDNAAADVNMYLKGNDLNFLVAGLDMLSAIIQALNDDKAIALVERDATIFFEVLGLCMDHYAGDVLQSAYALLGDCAQFVFPVMRPYIKDLIPFALGQLDINSVADEEIEEYFNAISNSCWALGEIALRDEARDLMPFVDSLATRFMELLENPNVAPFVLENSVTACGRLGLFYPEILINHLGSGIEEFLATTDEVVNSDEKASALKGFGLSVLKRPEVLGDYLPNYLKTIALITDNEPGSISEKYLHELHALHSQVLSTYRSIIPNFEEYLQRQIPNHYLKILHGRGLI